MVGIQPFPLCILYCIVFHYIFSFSTRRGGESRRGAELDCYTRVSESKSRIGTDLYTICVRNNIRVYSISDDDL